MKIVLLHYTAPPVVGGVESVIGHHARLMADDGLSVSIIAGRGSQSDPRVPFISLPQVDSRSPDVQAMKEELDTGRVPFQFDHIVTSLVDTLNASLGSASLLIAHNVCSLNKNLVLTAALKVISEQQSNPHIILWHHDLAWSSPRFREELHPGYPWDLLRTDWVGTTQVTISEPRRQELAALLGVSINRIQVVPNGMDTRRFLKLEDQTVKLISGLDLLAPGPLFLLPVRITSRKNIELAIRTLAVLRKNYPKARLVVTGPLGPHNPANIGYFNQLTALRSKLGLDEAVLFLAELSHDYLPDEVIADFYRMADALLFPSREEGFGIPVLEAGLAGIPVFCADIPALRELGADNATYFSPDATPEQVSALIVNRLSSDLAFALRLRVKRDYSWQRIYSDRIKPLLSG